MDDHSKLSPEVPGHHHPEPTEDPAGQAPAPLTVPSATSEAHGKNHLFSESPLLWLAVNLIEQAPRRVRRALKSQTEAVMRSIERFGFRIPILVRTKTGGGRYEVIDGHTRLAAALRLGAEQVPCILVDDLPEVETRRLALSLNKLQEGGDWDKEALWLEIGEILEITGQLEIPGFAIPELEALRFGADTADVEDPADDLSGLAVSAMAVSRPGDIWIAGDHIIQCGSARDAKSLAALLDGQVANAVFTDPPYNVKINGNVRSAGAGFAEFAEASGEMSRAEFATFLAETLGNAASVLSPGGVLYACMDWRHVGEMTEALETLGLGLLNICVWVKTNPGMGSLYRSQHELVFVSRRPGAGHQNNVQLGKYGRNRSNVWTYAGATGGAADVDDDFATHPTVKPIRLVMDALLDVTAPGDLVVDPFLGSGTTLLAAERTRRCCIGVEIEPRYVDLTIRRWQEMTGGQAIHAESGASFDNVAAANSQGGHDDGEGF
jgi:DNA modification methylase